MAIRVAVPSGPAVRLSYLASRFALCASHDPDHSGAVEAKRVCALGLEEGVQLRIDG
jgi:hypothetical protein